jgi:hypothetical protein
MSLYLSIAQPCRQRMREQVNRYPVTGLDPKPFARLAPSEIEDCLCIYKDELLGRARGQFRRSPGCGVARRLRC